MITLKEATLCYKKNKPILEHINQDIASGCIYGLLGKNGEGKTTLLNILSGQIFLDSGSCQVFDENPAERNVSLLQKLFLLPEEISLPDVTAEAYIKMYAPFYPTFREDIFKSCFDQLEIDATARLNKMSQGQRKKVAITLALSAHTPLLLMDEPTNGLDIPSKTIFRKLVASFTEENQTIIISTHQVRDLESLIDSVLILDNKDFLMNCSLNEVSSKLFFHLVRPYEKVLYSDTTPMGTMGVGENLDGETTSVSLELLFNAATQHPAEIKRLFNR